MEIHAVLVSHNHYDHLDLNTLQEIQKFYKNAIIYSPSNTNERTIKAKKAVELNWWENSELKTLNSATDNEIEAIITDSFNLLPIIKSSTFPQPWCNICPTLFVERP